MNTLLLIAPLLLGAEPKLEFNRDIRPILSDACFHCHGPDRQKQKGGLHLDTSEGAKDVLVAGKPEESLLIERILEKDPKRRMPPAGSGLSLKPAQIEMLKTWVQQGGEYQNHWAFIAPKKAELPNVQRTDWEQQPFDRFVLARLEKEGLQPSPAADATTLLRRMSLDLTGLPPTPGEVKRFLEGHHANPQKAIEHAIDRLLASPRFGERMAKPWLDAARYADTNGYQTDGDRVMWRWRDWVIDAFNQNMPFDRFTIEQLAGDMLPNPTLDQRIATGFNRNHRGNSEGGVIPEEYAVEYVVDRVDTTSTVWLGLTVGCARCHNHKYDPISQKEFYQLFAYFNNVPEKGKAIKYGNSPPYIQAPTREQQKEWPLLKEQLQRAESRWQDLQPKIDTALSQWEKSRSIPWEINWHHHRGLLSYFSLDNKYREPGAIGEAMAFPGNFFLEYDEVGDFGFFDRFTIAAWVKPDAGGGSIVSRMAETDRADGYHIFLEKGALHVQLVKRWLDDAIRVETEAKLTPGQWQHVAVSYDGTRLASGVRVLIDGRPAPLKVHLDDLNQSFKTKEPFRIGAGGSSRFKGMIDEVRVYDRVLSNEDVGLLADRSSLAEILATPLPQRTPGQKHHLRSYFLDRRAPAAFREAEQQLLKARKELDEFERSLPTSMVMEEMSPPRTTHILVRGEYDKPGAIVSPGVPEALPAMSKFSNNRLGLAQWLTDGDNPLTARVAVNRFWQMLFGIGIVKSVEDFGAQGEWPSHPELLDWLAVDFQQSGWDVKKLLKTILLSATYQQSSKQSKTLAERDPDNRLLARGPRVRLSAEMIRDQALFVSGLLVEKVGGPSVHPYQPAGLVKELHGADEELQDHGPNLYRRGLYTFWKRTVAPPGMMTFDAANREICVVRESRTNTPLQALNLMNDVTFIEAARVLAQRVLKAETDNDARLSLIFRLAISREPTDAEARILKAGLQKQRAHFDKDVDAASKLVRQGEWPVDGGLNAAELASWTALASLVLNLDETITKE